MTAFVAGDRRNPPAAAGEFLGGTAGWIDRNLERFAPAGGAASLTELLDLAIVCRSVRGGGIPAGILDTWLDRITDVFTRPAFRDSLLGSVRQLRYYLWLFALLRAAGRMRSPGVHRLMQQMIDSLHSELEESAADPLDLMELRYILDLGAFEHRLPASDRLLAMTVPELAAGRRQVAESQGYAVTHLILYLSDMAANPLSGLEPRLHGLLGRLVDDLLPLYAGAAHWDITAELLLCRRALRLPGTAAAGSARAALLGAQLPGGATPGTEFDPAIRASLAPADRAGYTFRTCYHATLAACLYTATVADSARIARR